jgi:hypothetical protein
MAIGFMSPWEFCAGPHAEHGRARGQDRFERRACRTNGCLVMFPSLQTAGDNANSEAATIDRNDQIDRMRSSVWVFLLLLAFVLAKYGAIGLAGPSSVRRGALDERWLLVLLPCQLIPTSMPTAPPWPLWKEPILQHGQPLEDQSVSIDARKVLSICMRAAIQAT